MSIVSRAFVTTKASSYETGREAATDILQGFAEAPRLVLVYLSVNHDQAAFLKGLREILGAEVPIVGCSTQGVIGRGMTREEGYAANVLALGGDSISFAQACVEDIAVDTALKGKALGQALRSQLAVQPTVTILLYDPLTGADTDLFLAGLNSQVECPIVGGGAAHAFNYGALQQTYQYFGDRVMSRGAVAFAISGTFTAELGVCHGCSPVGVEMTVTKADGNVLLELDGRPAVDVWREISSSTDQQVGLIAALAIGVHRAGGPGATGDEYLVRAAYAIDAGRGGLILGSAIATGTRIMLHHRTSEDVFQGAEILARSFRQRLAGKTIRAILCFECGARTKPFLGDEDTLRENLLIQREIGPEAAWMGGMFWGELYPVDGRPTFHNYSYPILAIAD
jgi:hypothetical protein